VRYVNLNDPRKLKKVLNNVINRWKNEYYSQDGWLYEDCLPPKKDTYNKLKKCLKENPSIEEFVKIIGNTSWTHYSCIECGKDKLIGVIFNTGDDYYGNNFICADCLDKVDKLINIRDE
jgi:hypothetical protein